MRLPAPVVFLSIVLLGALVLSPMVAMLEIDPLPGDLKFSWQNHAVFLPFTQSAIASVVLGLLFMLARR
jgi:hypothetical protein